MYERYIYKYIYMFKNIFILDNHLHSLFNIYNAYIHLNMKYHRKMDDYKCSFYILLCCLMLILSKFLKISIKLMILL